MKCPSCPENNKQIKRFSHYLTPVVVIHLTDSLFVGVRRIELRLPAPKAGVLPVYDTPNDVEDSTVSPLYEPSG